MERNYSYDVYPPNPHIAPVPFWSQPDARQEKLFAHKMLLPPLRQYVIKKIKDPLRKALIARQSFLNLVVVLITIIVVAWRLRKHVGKVTKENSVFKNVHIMLDLAELVKQCHHNRGRDLMLNSFNEIGVAICAHDPYWRYIAFKMADYLIKQAEAGNWVMTDEPPPKVLAPCWDEAKFQGGYDD